MAVWHTIIHGRVGIWNFSSGIQLNIIISLARYRVECEKRNFISLSNHEQCGRRRRRIDVKLLGAGLLVNWFTGLLFHYFEEEEELNC